MLKLLWSVAILMSIVLFNPYFGYTEKVTQLLAEFYTENFGSDTPGESSVKINHQGVALPVKKMDNGGDTH